MEKNLRKFTKTVEEAQSYSYEQFNYHGIIEQLHFIDQRQAELLDWAVLRAKEEHQPYYCHLDRMISGGRILWNAITICKMAKTSWQTWNLNMNEIWWIIQRTCFIRGWENLGRRYSDCWDRRIGNFECIRNISQLITPKMMKNSYFLWQVIQQKNHGETSNPKNPVWDGNPP